MRKISKIILVFGFMFCAAVIALAYVYNDKGNISEVQLPQNFESSLYDDAFENTGEIRIMSSNLLVDYKSWGGTPAKPRAMKYLALLDAYKPDVIGVQEFCENWYCAVNHNLPDGYKLVNPLATGLFFRMTAMIYNSDTLKLIESSSFSYEMGDPRLRRVVWAVFEDKETGKRFAVTNTHLDLLREGQYEELTNVMRSQRDELLNCIEELSKRFDCPVFSAGDYNTAEDTPYTKEADIPEIYNSLAEKLVDTKFAGKNQVCGPERGWNSMSYDHIFMKGNAEINSFCLMSYDYLTDMSDHYTIFADVTL
ncbi:MAG: hypothetical protein K2I14_05975 [Eubacterium sp.]|nr:hypothetical protein [Eubacterium sp.]